MELSDIVVGTVGGQNWLYKRSGPCAFKVNFTLDPCTAYMVPIVKEEFYTGDYESYILSVLKQYCYTEKTGEGSWTSGTRLSFPWYTLRSYKSAFLKSTETAGEGNYTLYCYDGTDVRLAHYNDYIYEGPGGNQKEIACIIGRAAGYWDWYLERGLVIARDDQLITFEDQRESSVNYVEFLDSFPVFFSEENLNQYLRSADPDPTKFGGTLHYFGYNYTGEEVVEEDTSTPGDVIEGTFTDLGASLSSGMMRAIVVDDENLKKFSNLIKEGWLAGSLPDNTIAIKTLKTPSKIATKTDVDETIYLSTKNAAGIQGKYILNQFQKFSFGTIKIPESFNNFLDYTNTNIAIFLPYSGLHQLEAKTVVNSTITLDCGIDYITGGIIYYITVDRDGVKQVLYEFNGNVEMQTPLSALDYSQKITQFLSGIAGVTTAIAMGPGATALTVGAATLGAAENAVFQDPRTFSVGNSVANYGWTGIQYPYLVFTRSKVSYPDGYGEHFGYPSMKKEHLGSLTGYTKVAEIHLDGLECLEEERQELETLLKNGVIL